MVLDKYITVKDNKILVGQYPSSGAWFCKELGAEDCRELDMLIGDVIQVLNKYNKKEVPSAIIKK